MDILKKQKKTSLTEFTSLTEKHLNILSEAGIDSISALVNIPVVELKTILDTTLNRATLILKEAKQNLPIFKVVSGLEVKQRNNTRQYISTGCKALDDLLGGKGVEAGSITQFYAQYGTGKSQIAFSTIANALKKDKNGDSGCVIVIDTEGTCYPERIQQILDYYRDELEQSPQETLKNLFIINPADSEHQTAILKLFVEEDGLGYKKYIKTSKPVKLLVVDSLCGLFRAEFTGRGVLSERQQKINSHLRDLYLFGTANNIPILVTNQVISSPDPFVYAEIPVGGNVVAHACTYIVSLLKRSKHRIAKLEDSSRLPAREIVYKLGSRGVLDIDEEDYTVEEYFKNKEQKIS